jgi:hypothetical protein
VPGVSDDSSSFARVLTEECITHFVRAVEVPLPVLYEESAHPYENNQETRKKITINGASQLIIRFDPRYSK